MTWGIIFALILAVGSPAWAVEEWAIDLEYPSVQGDFYASGAVSFPPGAMRSEDQLLVRTLDTGAEIATCVKVTRRWPDGSILRADILFPANNSRQAAHALVFGEGVRRSRLFREPAVLPTIAFSLSGAPRAAEAVDVSVGTINIRVDRSPRIYYYWHLAPILALVLLTWARSRRTVLSS